jgi:HD-like signal output (HDOD) protein
VAELQRLPAQRPALVRVVQAADDPDCSLCDLARVVAADPAFTTRVLRLANSPWYGRVGRVTSVGPAVATIGAQTLRGLAVGMSLDLGGVHGALPQGFWERAVLTGCASRLVAAHVGAPPGDAFCVGLLSQVGQALLFRAAPREYAGLLEVTEPAALAQAERSWCGMTSGEVGAAALRAAGLPSSVCDVVAQAGGGDAALARSLRGGVVVCTAIGAGRLDDEARELLAALTGGRLGDDAARSLVLRSAAEAAALAAALG